MRNHITIRRSTDADQSAIYRLALLDDRAAPSGDTILAFVGDELRAAMPLAQRDRFVADPFHLTNDVVRLLEAQASQEAAA